MKREVTQTCYVRNITTAAVVGAIYAIFTILPPFNLIGYGPIQFRVSESIMLLCLIHPSFAIGAGLGCLLANIFSPFANGFDMVLGTAATVLAAFITYKGREFFKKHIYLAPLPTILINSVVVGTYLPFIIGAVPFSEVWGNVMGGNISSIGEFLLAFGKSTPIWTVMLNIFIGETVVCYSLGMILYYLFMKNKRLNKMFI